MRIFSKPFHCSLALASLLMVGGPGSNPGGTSDLTFRSAVSEVRLTFFAGDNHNQNIEVRPEDFAVVDNELVIRKFRSFAKSEDIKVNVVVLIDSSASVVSRFKAEITDVLQLVSQTRWIAEDRLSIISFGQQKPSVLCSGNCGDAHVSEKLSAMRSEGLTPLFDAMQFASEFIVQHQRPDDRSVIILLSDGDDTISRASSGDALTALRDSEAQIYAVDLNTFRNRSQGSAMLKAMADASGGRYFSIQDNAPEILSAMLNDLHNGYTVTYSLPDRALGLHRVRLLPTHNLNLRFRCRDGYNYLEPR